MQFELQGRTDAGRDLVALAERLAEDFATRAGQHDREGSYPFETIRALRERLPGRAGAAELGGMGVESVHDLLVASSRLARGDPAVAIGVNMHLIPVASVAHRWRAAARAATSAARGPSAARWSGRPGGDGDGRRDQRAAARTSPDRPPPPAGRPRAGPSTDEDLLHHVARRHASLHGDHVRGRGRRRAIRLRPGPGRRSRRRMHDDWDALGMRASGSQSVSFEDVRLPGRRCAGASPPAA